MLALACLEKLMLEVTILHAFFKSKGHATRWLFLKFCFYQGSAASLKLTERRAPYRNVGYQQLLEFIPARN